jgi:hypothetical protein
VRGLPLISIAASSSDKSRRAPALSTFSTFTIQTSIP